MTNSKAINLLDTFQEEELKAFKKHLQKNYNSGNLICRIFHYYLQKKPLLKKQSALLTLAIAYKKIVKKELDTKGRKVFLNALHNLNKALKDFLLIKELEKDSFEKDQLLIKIFQERKLSKFVNQTIQQRTQKIETAPIKNQWQSLQLLQLAHHAYFEGYEAYFSNKNLSVQRMMTHLDEFYTSFKMYYSCEMENRSRLMPESYQVLFKTEIINYIKAQPKHSEPLAYLYFLCFELIKIGQKKQYLALENYLVLQEHQLSLSDQQFANALLITFAIRAYRKGNRAYANIIFSKYKNGVTKGLYFYNGQLPNNDFHNIVATACAVKEFEWAKHFVTAYQKYLPPAFKQQSIHLATAIIHFQEGDFEQVLPALNQVVFEDISFELRAKALILRTFYELNENVDLILDFCTSFQRFLQGNRHIQPAISSSYLVLIKYIKQFVKQPIKLTKEEIIAQIKAEKSLQFHQWLLAKVKELN